MNFARGLKRINLKEQLTELRVFVKECRPLVEADKQLRRAYMAGYRARIEEEIAESKTGAGATVPAESTSLDPDVAEIVSEVQEMRRDADAQFDSFVDSAIRQPEVKLCV